MAVVKEGKPVAELEEIFKLVAKHKLVLQMGHSSAEECLTLLEAAKNAGVTKLVVTHAMADPIHMTTAQLKAAAKLGAKLECVWASNLQGPQSHLPSNRHWRNVSSADYAKAMQAVGAEHFILSSDLGQFLNPVHTDGYKSFIIELRAAGISEKEIDLMARRTPAALLDISERAKSSED